MGLVRRYPLPKWVSKGGPFEISIFIRSTMPYCRECGKEVQEDWISCPYCSKPIGPPASNSIGLKDSVVMGDVSIADASVECARCKSTGVTITACMVCKNPAFCSVCEGNVNKKRDTVCGEHHYDSSIVEDFHVGNICDECFDSIRKKTCDGSCSHCGICIVLEYSDDGECYHCIEIREDIERNENHKQSYIVYERNCRNWARNNDDPAEAREEERNADGHARQVKKFSKEVEKLKKILNSRKKA